MSNDRKIADHLLHDILPLVTSPARYIGGERGSVVKDFDSARARIVLAFPDVYEIGSGNLGQEILYHIINSYDDYLAERTYAPWDDLEKLLEEKSIPLYSLENKIPVREFDLVGFTVNYELGFTGILTILNSSGLPLSAADRGFPLVGMGGVCAFNPSVMSKFFDFFNIGDGEDNVVEIAKIIAASREEIDKNRDDQGLKKKILDQIADLPGIYVPSIGVRSTKRAIVNDLDSASFPKEAIIPYFGDMKNRVTLEVFRGCTQGCRFCQAGYIYRPYRKRSVENLQQLAHASFAHTGHSEISLTSLNTTDYPELTELIQHIIDMKGNRPLQISIPSSRISSFDGDFAAMLQPYSSGSVTLAIEAGTERLRRVINKRTTDDEIFNTVRTALQNGLGVFKLYFMVGLPTETTEDIEAIISIVQEIRHIYRTMNKAREIPDKTHFRIKVAVANFVPKPYTPFQWCALDSVETLIEKHRMLTPIRNIKGVHMKAHFAEGSFIEGTISRGDEKIGEVIETAWRMGSRFESWKERLDFDLWMKAFDQVGVDPLDYLRERDQDEILPWDNMPSGIDKQFLRKELDKALTADETPDCFEDNCNGCGLWKDVCINLPRKK